VLYTIWKRRHTISYICLLFMGDGVKCRPRCIIRRHVRMKKGSVERSPDARQPNLCCEWTRDGRPRVRNSIPGKSETFLLSTSLRRVLKSTQSVSWSVGAADCHHVGKAAGR
jgi:hypothetical protein